MPTGGHRAANHASPARARAAAWLLALALLLPAHRGGARRTVRSHHINHHLDAAGPGEPAPGGDLTADIPDRAGEPLVPRVLLDRHGRLWRWRQDVARELGAQPGVFCHQDMLRTEQEIENEAEPIIEVRDPRLLTTRLVPVPANQIRLGDWVVLPGLGELSPVTCIEPGPRQHRRWRLICTDNGDWARRTDSCPVLRGDPPLSLARHHDAGGWT